MSRERSWGVAMVAVLILALVIRLAVAVHFDLPPKTDAADYDRYGVSIASGRGFPDTNLGAVRGATAFRPPLYPLVLAGVYEVSGTSSATTRWRDARIVEALLGTVAVGLIGLIALRIFGRPEALAATAIAVVYPPLLLVGSSLVSETVFVPLVLAGVWLVLRYRDEQRLRWLLLAGVAGGLATLSRSNGFLIVLALGFGVWILRPRWSRRALAAPATLLGIAALVVLPWTVRNAIELHAFVPVSTQTGLALAGQYNDVSAANGARWLPPNGVPAYRHFFEDPSLDEADLDSKLRDAAIDYAVDHPQHVFAAGFWNGLRLLNLDDPIPLELQAAHDLGQPPGLARLSVYGFWILAVLALFGCAIGAARRLPAFIWLVLAAVIVSIMFIGGLTRYRIPADPILILLAAPALVWALEAAARLRAQPGAPG